MLARWLIDKELVAAHRGNRHQRGLLYGLEVVGIIFVAQGFIMNALDWRGVMLLLSGFIGHISVSVLDSW